MDGLRVSELARRSGVPATTLRYYEQQGLLPAERTPAGYRVYGPHAVDRLDFITTSKELGLSLAEIGELLEVWERGSCRQVRADLRPRLHQRLDQARDRQQDLAAFAGVLDSALAHLDSLPDQAGPCDANCSFLRLPASRTSGATPVPVPDPAPAPHQLPEPPIACSISGTGQADRLAEWHRLVEPAGRHRIPGGWTIHLTRVALDPVLSLVRAEAECCPFLHFDLRIDPHRIRLQITAPAAGVDLLDELIAPIDARHDRIGI